MQLSPESSPISPPTVFKDSYWIWPDNPIWDLYNCYACFRKKIELPTLPNHAPLHITADQSYRLYVNGIFVCRGPARGFQKSWPYDEIDIRHYLKKGTNLIAIRAYNPGMSNFQYLSQGTAGLLVSAQWDNFHLHSNKDWKTQRQPGIRKDSIQTSLQLFPQEHIDLRTENDDWTTLAYDDSKWVSPVTQQWNCAPWFQLEPRGIPMLLEETIPPKKLLAQGHGKNYSDYTAVRDVVALRCNEDRSHKACNVDVQHHPHLLKISPLGKGSFQSYLFDFGKTVVGSLRIKVQGAAGGEYIDSHFGETITEETFTLDQSPIAHSRMAFGDRMICRAGDFNHDFYHHYGFRYLDLTIRDATKEFNLEVLVRRTGYPLELTGSLESSEPELQTIWNACVWTQQCCSLDAYVDTPWREQAQWWGDARVQAWNTFHLSGDSRLFLRGIRQIAAQTTPDGVTYGHTPTMAHSCILPDFTLVWFLTFWDYYWQTGSLKPFLEHRSTIDKALTYFKNRIDPKFNLITYDSRFWLFLDWSDIFKGRIPTVYNLWLLIALGKLIELNRIAGQSEEAEKLTVWQHELREALQSLIGEDGLIREGFDDTGKRVETSSIHGQTLALEAELPGIDSKHAEAFLRDALTKAPDTPGFPSAYWLTYVFSLLIRKGHGENVVEFIRKHWKEMAEYGTTWETFHPKFADESHSHAWSAHPLYHLMQTLGGIIQTAPNWKAVAFNPVFIGNSNRCTIPTPNGPITSQWRRTSAGIEVELRLPEGVRAQVDLGPEFRFETEKGFSKLLPASTSSP